MAAPLQGGGAWLEWRTVGGGHWLLWGFQGGSKTPRCRGTALPLSTLHFRTDGEPEERSATSGTPERSLPFNPASLLLTSPDCPNRLIKEGLTNQRTVGVGCCLANGKQVAASRNAFAIEALDSHDPPSVSEYGYAGADVYPFAKEDPAHSISEEFFHARCDQRCE